MKIKTSGIINESIVDGPGIRYVIFFQGCYHNCRGCHNPNSHSLDNGKYIEIDEMVKSIENNPLLDGITLSGGEPMLQPKEALELISRIRHLNLSIMLYTGYTFEQIKKLSPLQQELFHACDIVVDGRFEESKKSLTLLYRGSSNQRIINPKKSLHTCFEYTIDENGRLYEKC